MAAREGAEEWKREMSEPVVFKLEVDVENKVATLTTIRLLDYFAGQALAGNLEPSDTGKAEDVAKTCYDIAEEMLRERERRTERPEALSSTPTDG